MKKTGKISALFFALLFSFSAAFADTLNLSTETIKGKFHSVCDGLIVINQKGIKKSYTRIEHPDDIYADYISYRISPFSTRVENTPCRVIFLDTWNVKIKLPNANSIDIPRYRIADLEINIR